MGLLNSTGCVLPLSLSYLFPLSANKPDERDPLRSVTAATAKPRLQASSPSQSEHDAHVSLPKWHPIDQRPMKSSVILRE